MRRSSWSRWSCTRRPAAASSPRSRPCRPSTRLVTYYTAPALQAAITAQLASVVRELSGQVAVRVELLPQIPGVGGEVAA